MVYNSFRAKTRADHTIVAEHAPVGALAEKKKIENMETFIEAKNLVINPQFAIQRLGALSGLRLEVIEAPIVEIIESISRLPYCFTLQSCYGHFLHETQKDSRNVEPLQALRDNSKVEYRIAYIALCIENENLGKAFLNDLSKLEEIDLHYIQYGSAEWFWERQKNSYVLQVEPERYKARDRCEIEYQEALHVEKVRNKFYKELRNRMEKWC